MIGKLNIDAVDATMKIFVAVAMQPCKRGKILVLSKNENFMKFSEDFLDFIRDFDAEFEYFLLILFTTYAFVS